MSQLGDSRGSMAKALSLGSADYGKYWAEWLSITGNISMIFEVTKEDKSTVQGMARAREEPNVLDSLRLK